MIRGGVCAAGPSESGGGAGGWHKASVFGCLPLAAPIGLSPLHILTLCGPERVPVGGGGGRKHTFNSIERVYSRAIAFSHRRCSVPLESWLPMTLLCGGGGGAPPPPLPSASRGPPTQCMRMYMTWTVQCTVGSVDWGRSIVEGREALPAALL